MTGEHVLGYLLRLAEMNGYKGPHWLPGFNQSRTVSVARAGGGVEFSALAELEVLTGVNSLERDLGGYRLPGRLSLGGGVFMPPHSLHLMWRKVCPQCLIECRFIRAAWDQVYWIACPIHGCLMVHKCPECLQPLRWRYARIDHCCEASPFAAIRPTPAPREVVSLMRALAYSSMVEAPPPPESFSKLLRGLRAEQMGFLIARIGNIMKRIDGTPTRVRDSQLSFAEASDEAARFAQLIAEWPGSFHKFVMHGEAIPAETFLKGRREFGGFYRYLSRNMPKSDFAFIYKEYEHVVRVSWSTGDSPVVALRDDRAPVGSAGDSPLPPRNFNFKAACVANDAVSQRQAAVLLNLGQGGVAWLLRHRFIAEITVRGTRMLRKSEVGDLAERVQELIAHSSAPPAVAAHGVRDRRLDWVTSFLWSTVVNLPWQDCHAEIDRLRLSLSSPHGVLARDAHLMLLAYQGLSQEEMAREYSCTRSVAEYTIRKHLRARKPGMLPPHRM